MVRLVANTGSTDVMTAYLGACSERKNITPAELKLFQVVLDKGSLEEQIRAVEALAFVPQRPVRRTLIGILSNSAAPLDVRERATEMLHLHESRETAEACAKALGDPSASIRFWAAYTLGQIAGFRKGIPEIAAPALASVLDDREVAPGWWSVGREAQASIVGLRGDPGERERLQAEIRRVQQDPTASAEDRRWAECYSDS